MTWTAPLSLVAENLISALVARRYALGMSQRELARRLKCTQRQVCCWEHGQHQPTLGWLVLWAGELDVQLRPLVVESHRRRPANREIAA